MKQKQSLLGEVVITWSADGVEQLQTHETALSLRVLIHPENSFHIP